MPIIVLEGVDGSGKSTLAEEIAAIETARVVHTGPPSYPDMETAVSEVLKPLDSYDGEELLVFDRAHWGCPVYGPIYRPDTSVEGYGEIGQQGFMLLDLVFHLFGAVTLLVDVDAGTAAKRCVQRGEDYIDLSHIDKLRDRYRAVATESLTFTKTFTLEKPGDTHQAAVAAVVMADLAKASARDDAARYLMTALRGLA